VPGMTRVAVAGATGWTGRAVAEAVLGAPDLQLVGAVARSAAGQDLGVAWGGDPVGVTVATDVEEALGGGLRGDRPGDYASAAKADAPSGTARELAERLGETAPAQPADVAVADTSGLREARGATVAGTQVHSVRLPSFVVSTEVVFALPDERLVIRHDAGPTPEPYVAGTLIAIRAAPGLTGLVRGLDTLLLSRDG